MKIQLKVRSCPYYDSSIQLFILSFTVHYFLNLLLPRKLQDFTENLHFFCLFISFVLIHILTRPVTGTGLLA